MRLVHGLLAATLVSLAVPTDSRAEDCTSNLMIVIDRSCSMTSNSIMGKTRWDIAVDAINKTMTENAGKLRFGLAMFPTKNTVTNKCVQADPLLAPAANNEQKVGAQLTANRPGAPCITNIDEGIKQASVEPALFTADRRSFVLLITDGEQSNTCNGGTATADPLTVQYIKGMYDQKVPTYVVGFDIGSNTAAQKSLNSFAIAGGLPKTGTTSYYAANNQAELEATLNQLVGLTGGEVGICRGQPCPDGRCLSATAMCMSGFCIETAPDMAGQDNTGPGGNGEDLTGTLSTGCSCEVGGRSATSFAGLSALGLLAGMWVLNRRRSRQGSAA